MNPEPDARAVIERYLHDVLSKPRMGAADEIVADANLRQSLESFRRAFGGLDVTPNVVVGAGEHVAVHLSAHGTHRGIFQGVPPSGRPWTAGCSAVYRVDRGRIVDSWVTWDALAILEQIGAICRPPSSSA